MEHSTSASASASATATAATAATAAATDTATATAGATAPPSTNARDALFANLRAAVDEVLETHPSLRCDPETIIFMERQQNRLSCALSESVAQFDQWREWDHDGALSATAWIDTACHLPKKEARAQVRRGKALPELPLAAAAWRNGDIGAAQVDVLIRAKRPVTEDALAGAEGYLVQAGIDMKFASFCAVVAYWEQMADQDGTDEAALAKEARRDAYVVPSPDGYLGKMNFDVIGGAIVAKEHKRIEDEFFAADWAEAKERLGRDPHVDELARTPAQRRADAMIEMAVRSASTPAGAQRPEPLFSVLIDYPTLWGRISRLQEGPIVAPGSLLRWLDEATFERIIFSPDTRGECSKTSRFFTGATRRVIEARDLECQHEFCDLSAEKCQIDHIVPFSQGGLTEQTNAQVLCGPHNRMRYERPPPDG
jgi:hypothetical protein